MTTAQSTTGVRTIAVGAIADSLFSRDGSLLFLAQANLVSIINMATGYVAAEYRLPVQIGALSLSPDGQYLGVVGRQQDPPASGADSLSFVALRLDLTDGSMIQLDSRAYDPPVSFFDIAMLPDGTALLSSRTRDTKLAGSLYGFDFERRTFTVPAQLIAEDAALVSSVDGRRVAVHSRTFGRDDLSIFEVGSGVVASITSNLDPFGGAAVPTQPPSGWNNIQAISPDGSRIVDESLRVYNGNLQFQISLATKLQGLGASGLAFSASGARLYVLNAQTDRVYALETADWRVLGSYAVGADVNPADSRYRNIFGNTLSASGDGRYLSVFTSNSVQLIDLASASLGEGTSGNDTLVGTLLYGFDGDDVLTSATGGGPATLVGGAGDDLYVIDSAGVRIEEQPGSGVDTVRSSVSATLSMNVERLVLTGSGAISGFGNEGDNQISGNEAANDIDGYIGDDTLDGAGGDDTLMGSIGRDQISGGNGDDLLTGGIIGFGDEEADTLDGGGGNDWIVARSLDSVDGGAGLDRVEIDLSASRTAATADLAQLGSGITIRVGDITLRNVEFVSRLGLTSFSDDVKAGFAPPGDQGIAIAGEGGDDTIVGTDKPDLIRGGVGDDVLTGGIGRITGVQTIDGRDRIYGEAGDDTIFIEADGAFADGGLDADVIVGGAGLDDIHGGRGDDVLLGGGGADMLSGDEDNDQLFGEDGVDSLYGNAGSDVLDGGLGADRMEGGFGNDGFVIDDGGDLLIETTGGGWDVALIVAANYLLTAGASIEVLLAEAGTAPINIAGNELDQTITGNDGANILSGNGGADTLNGGLGDDVYRIFTTADVIADGGGFDTVFASGTSYFLYSTAEVEYLSTAQQSGSEAIYMVGNATSQVIVGNYGANILNGRGGGNGAPDTLIGLFGDDVYGVFGQGDVVREIAGAGNDVVYANASYALREGTEIEALSAVDQSAGDAASAFTLRGNGLAQAVIGNGAANILDGRGGSDTLIGLGGADVFAFTTALDATGNVDRVQDFASGSDRIGLASDVFAGVTEGGILIGEFVIAAAAAEADDRLVYDQASGRLSYDADGSGTGAALLFAQFAAGTLLAASDFVAVPPVAGLVAG